jgi:hypothetical protein
VFSGVRNTPASLVFLAAGMFIKMLEKVDARATITGIISTLTKGNWVRWIGPGGEKWKEEVFLQVR